MLDTAICAIQGIGRITFDHLRCITRGEQAVRVTTFFVSCLELMACCCVTQHMFLALNTPRHGVYRMSQTNEMIGCLELTGRWSLIWANK